MIFALGNDGVVLFCMLSEQDIGQMRTGVTKFVDERQLGERTFQRVVISLHKTDAEALRLLKQQLTVQQRKELEQQGLKGPEPTVGEAKCIGCQGINPIESLFEGRCICCWAAKAKKLESQSN